MEVETCRQWREVSWRERRGTEGMEALRKREDLTEKGQKQQRRGTEREAGREQHGPAVTMWCGSFLSRYYRLEFNLTMFILGMDVV